MFPTNYDKQTLRSAYICKLHNTGCEEIRGCNLWFYKQNSIFGQGCPVLNITFKHLVKVQWAVINQVLI